MQKLRDLRDWSAIRTIFFANMLLCLLWDHVAFVKWMANSRIESVNDARFNLLLIVWAVSSCTAVGVIEWVVAQSRLRGCRWFDQVGAAGAATQLTLGFAGPLGTALAAVCAQMPDLQLPSAWPFGALCLAVSVASLSGGLSDFVKLRHAKFELSSQ